jgi:hypothetical protein
MSSSTVTKKGRAHRNPTALSALPAPGPWTAQSLIVRLTFIGTHPDLRPSPLCLLIQVQFDRPIETLLDPAHISHKVLSHRHITTTLAFHSQYVHAPKAQAAFFSTKTTNLIVLEVLVSFLYFLFSYSTNLATYQT